MSSAVSILTRRALAILAVAVAAFAIHTAGAHANATIQGTAWGSGYNGAGTCTVTARLHLIGTSAHTMGNVTCNARQGYTILRMQHKRDGVTVLDRYSPWYTNSFGHGNTWHWTPAMTACQGSAYHPRWQAVVTAYLYDYYGNFKKAITATTSTPRVLC